MLLVRSSLLIAAACVLIASGCTFSHQGHAVYSNALRTWDADLPKPARQVMSPVVGVLETPILPVTIYVDAMRHTPATEGHSYWTYAGFRSLNDRAIDLVVPPAIAFTFDTFLLPLTGTVDLVYYLAYVVPGGGADETSTASRSGG